MSEHDGAVEYHEQEIAAHGPGPQARAPAIACRMSPPPDHFDRPEERKGIVQIEAPAPTPPDEFARLACRIRVGGRVAPVVVEVKGGSDVGKEDRATDGTQPSTCPGASPAMLRFPRHFAAGV